MNMMISLGGQAIILIISFLTRSIFISVFSEEYLGINGLFSSILNMLSLAELGIGTAITYSLYKPIAENDLMQIKLLMKFFRKTYFLIGIVVLSIGFLLTPFLQVFIKDTPDVPNLNIYFLLYVINSAISYFYTYKRILVIAYQKAYISTAYNHIFTIIRNVAQIILIIITKQFLVYLLVQMVCTILENIAISKKANAMFPFLKEDCIGSIDENSLNEIKKNTLAMLFHKIGGIVVLGTDNLLISKFIGITEVGVYSNYLMITNALTTVFNQIFNSLTASIGNLGASESVEKTRRVFKSVDLMGFWVYGFASICLINLMNPFIYLWVGEKYTFPIPIVGLIVFNFYINGMRTSVNTFKGALGLYWNDRYKPAVESVINLTLSILFINIWGIAGVFIGTAISTVTTSFWIEPYVLYRYGFKMSAKEYFTSYISFGLIVLLTGGFTYLLCNLVNYTTLFSLLAKLVICLIVPNIIFLVIFFRTDEFKFLISKLPIKIHK
jgi:O-antigen/teichoic acid export membrane protein